MRESASTLQIGENFARTASTASTAKISGLVVTLFCFEISLVISKSDTGKWRRFIEAEAVINASDQMPTVVCVDADFTLPGNWWLRLKMPRGRPPIPRTKDEAKVARRAQVCRNVRAYRQRKHFSSRSEEAQAQLQEPFEFVFEEGGHNDSPRRLDIDLDASGFDQR